MNNDTIYFVNKKLNNSDRKLKGPKTFKISNITKTNFNETQNVPKLRSLDILKNMYSEEAGKTIRSIIETKKTLKTIFPTEITVYELF